MFDVACGGAEVLRVIKFVWTLLDIVFFVVPIGLIVIITVDFLKNVISSKSDDMKKNLNIVIKRIIFCVLLFCVEPICRLSIGLLGDTVDVDWANCIEIAIDPNTDFSEYEVEIPEEDYSNNK